MDYIYALLLSRKNTYPPLIWQYVSVIQVIGGGCLVRYNYICIGILL